MKLTCIAGAFALLVLSGGCGKDAAKDNAPKPAEMGSAKPADMGSAKPAATDSGNHKPIKGLPLEVEVPADATPDDAVPGYRNADGTFAFSVRPDDSPGTPASLKATIGDMAKEWLDEKTVEGGWYVTHSMEKKERVEEADGTRSTKVTGMEYSLQFYKQIDNQWYRCTTILPKREHLDAVIKACTSLRKRA